MRLLRAPVIVARSLWQMLREGATPLVLLFLAGFSALFAVLTHKVIEGDTRHWDEALLLALRRPGATQEPIGPPWLKEAARDITSLGSFSVLFLVAALAIGFLAVRRQRAAAMLVAFSIAGGTALSTLLKMGFDRPRPELVPHMAEVFTASFPSGHAMLSAVTYLTLGALVARIQEARATRIYVMAGAVLITLVVGASRIYLGVHWPSDVLGGWCIGSSWALLCWMLMAGWTVAQPPAPRRDTW
jgi:undecaprenyl-diphosphatase